MNKKELLTTLKDQGFSKNIINAFEKIKREQFIPEAFKPLAYNNEALPLERGATISQPYTIAFMLALLELKPSQKILEVGSGSGYVLALLDELTKGDIYGIEIIRSLFVSSKQILSKHKNIKIINKNGSKGLIENAPFDRILISASSDKVPSHLYNQLKDEGIIVAPVKNSIFQIRKHNSKLSIKEFPGFVFVPLV